MERTAVGHRVPHAGGARDLTVDAGDTLTPLLRLRNDGDVADPLLVAGRGIRCDTKRQQTISFVAVPRRTALAIDSLTAGESGS